MSTSSLNLVFLDCRNPSWSDDVLSTLFRSSFDISLICKLEIDISGDNAIGSIVPPPI